MRLKLEDKLIRALGPGEYHDTVVPRLTLRVREKSRRWVIRYRLRGAAPSRLALGDLRVKTLAEARADAKVKLADVDKWVDPREARRVEREAAERRRIGEHIGRAVDSWLKDAKLGPARRWKGGLAGGTWAMGHIRRLKRTLGDRLLSELSVRDVERFRNEPEAAATRNRALTVARLFVAWARRRGLLETDPTAGLRKEREAERTRTLTDPELAALVRGFDVTRYGRAMRLLVLTGLRRNELLAAEWTWLDAEARVLTIPPEAEKTGRTRGEPRRVALSSAAGARMGSRPRRARGRRNARPCCPTT